MKNRSPIVKAITVLLFAVTIISMLLFTAGCKKKNQAAAFDYMTANLSEYIEFKEDYKKFKVEVDIAAPRDIDVDVAILSMLCSDKEEAPLYDGGNAVGFAEITAGDIVKIWYRGYLIGDDGKEIAVPGMSNFGNENSYALEIGSNGFIPGFELNLIGKKPSEYSKFEKITIGNVTDDMIVYISYTRQTGDDKKTEITENNVRVDLSEDVDAKFGLGFKANLMKLAIGEKADINAATTEASYKYTNVKINFATTCETNPIVIEAYFPYDYQKEDLRNENAIFEVYVEHLKAYDTPEFTDEYLKKKIEDKKINITLDELNGYEGNTLTDKYRDFAKKSLQKIYEDDYKALVEEQVWLHLDEISVAKKYPEDKVQEIYQDYIDDITDQFRTSGGQIYNSSLGQYKTYSTLDAYATVYVGAKTGESWKDVVYKEAQGFVKERLTMFYILKAEGLVPSDAVFQEEYNKIHQEYIDEYVSQYMSYLGKTKDDYTDAEYKDLVDECTESVNNNFDEEYFKVRTYYTILAKTIVTWPEVSTLDDRRSYPQDK